MAAAGAKQQQKTAAAAAAYAADTAAAAAAAASSAATSHRTHKRRSQATAAQCGSAAKRQALRNSKTAAVLHAAKVAMAAVAEAAMRGGTAAAVEAAAATVVGICGGTYVPYKRSAAAAAANAAADDEDADDDGDCAAGGGAEGEGGDGDEGDEDEDEDEVDAMHKSRMKQLTPFQKGVQLTGETKALVAMHVWQYAYEQYQTEGKEGAFHGSIQKTANFLRTGTRTVREVVRELDPKRQGLRAPVVLPVGVARRVSAHRTRAELTAEQITAARAFVADRIGRGACVTYRDITVHLGTDLLVHTVRRRLIELGFKVLPVRPRPAIDFAAPYWSSQFERFAVQMAEAWEAERDGSGAVIFMDESFCHLRHSRWQSVVDTTAADQVVKPRKSGEMASIPSGGSKGQLVIVVHAISSKGLLAESNEDGSLHKPPIDSKKHVTFTPSAELVYPVGAPPTSDYHNSLNGASFSNWVQLRLLPAFWQAYGKKRMYLVLDNCKVHCTRPKGFVPATAAQKKGALAKVLNDNSVKSIRAESGSYDAICHARNFMASKKDGGCTKAELLAAVKQLYANKPELCFTELQTILRRGAPDRPAYEWRQYEEFARPNFHKIVHTVQYNSAHNPIEIVWAAVKGHVADLHTADRTTAELLLHLREGFYGSADGAWKGVTPERCQKAIAHCKSVVTGIIRGSAKLRACYPDGTVEADMHADSFGEECRAKYGKIALSREAAAFADGQSTEYGSEGDDPDAIADWEADGGDDAAGLAD